MIKRFRWRNITPAGAGYDFETEDEGSYYLILEYMRGSTASELIQEIRARVHRSEIDALIARRAKMHLLQEVLWVVIAMHLSAKGEGLARTDIYGGHVISKPLLRTNKKPSHHFLRRHMTFTPPL